MSAMFCKASAISLAGVPLCSEPLASAVKLVLTVRSLLSPWKTPLVWFSSYSCFEASQSNGSLSKYLASKSTATSILSSASSLH